MQSLAATGNTCDKATMDKLSAIFQLSADNWYEVDFSRWGEHTRDNDKFEALKRAVICHKCVMISYVGAYKAESSRIIHPLKLLYKSRAWYVKAYCTEKKDFRVFKLSRIIRWKILGEEFTPISYPEPAEEETVSEQDSDPIILRFPKEVAYRVYDEFDIGQVRQQENGDLLVSATMPQDAWLTGFLLSFGAQVEVVSPQYLRDVLAAQAREIYEKNRSGEK